MAAFNEKYRPQSIADIRGQRSAKSLILEELRRRLDTPILLIGPPGVGKTSAARIIAMCANCEAGPELGTPCGACETCISVLTQDRGVYHEISGADHSKASAARQILDYTKSRPWSGRYRIIFIDEVQGLESDAADILLKKVEEPPEYIIFVFASSNPQQIRPALADRCVRVSMDLLSDGELLELAHAVCRSEKTTFETLALETLVDLSGGSARALVTSLGSATIDGHISAAGLIERCGLDWTSHTVDYLFAAARGDLPAQFAAMKLWLDAPENKVRAVRDLLQHCYLEYVSPQRVRALLQPAFRLITGAQKEMLVAALGSRARYLGRGAGAFWTAVTGFWTNAAAIQNDDGSLVGHITRFHLQLHPDDTGTPLPDPAPLAAPLALASQDLEKKRPARRSRVIGASVSSDVFLSRPEAYAICDVASFLVQERGLWFNARLELRFRELGIYSHLEASKFETGLKQKLDLRLQDWTNDRAFEFHWLVTHEVNDGGLVTRMLMHIPKHLRERVRDYVFDLLPCPADRLVPNFPDARWHAPPAPDHRLHCSLVKELLLSLDPNIEHWNEHDKKEPLIQLLRLSRRGQRAAGDVGQRFNQSRSLGPKAVEAATADRMALLSPVRDREWNWAWSGWEADEYKHRCAEREERKAAQARICAALPAGESPLQDRAREQRLADLRASWPDDPKLRRRSWAGWW